MELKKFSDGILKTGFVLENKIARTLHKYGWNVISNKYYEDDFEEKVREIDLLAYKVSRVQDFDVYTCLIISCKKNESNTWALLCRDINLKDPNSDLWPLHSWSNQLSIQHQLSIPGKAKHYYLDMAKLGVKDALSDPNVEIFAFQEMDSSSGAPKNQKAIYDSIISLIKAQAYEMTALPQRKKAASVYQFNLISVVDAKIIRLNFNDNEITPLPTFSEHYVSRYILNKRQSFSRIRFLDAEVFDKSLSDYSQLHAANLIWFDKISDDFYNEIEKDHDRLKIHLEDFKKEIRWSVFSEIHTLLNKHVDVKDIYPIWDKRKKSLALYLTTDHEILSALNTNSNIQTAVKDALKKVYRYTGEFHFDEDIPF